MRADGRGFNVGLDCDTPSTTCTPIPPGVSALVELLRDLIRQQRMDPTCSAITQLSAARGKCIARGKRCIVGG